MPCRMPGLTERTAEQSLRKRETARRMFGILMRGRFPLGLVARLSPGDAATSVCLCKVGVDRRHLKWRVISTLSGRISVTKTSNL